VRESRPQLCASDLYKLARAFAVRSYQPLGPADLQRALRVPYNRAAGLLEELEADRLLGSLIVGGSRRWHVGFQVDEARVSMLRALTRATD